MGVDGNDYSNIRNNIKLLTDRQLTELNEKYNFSIDGDNVVVDIKNYNRHTKHPITDSFFINSKIRKITLSPEAISIWIELTQDRLRYTLFDVQNAINKLYLLLFIYIYIN